MMLLPTEREEELLTLLRDKNLTEEEREKIRKELIDIDNEKRKNTR